MQELLFQVVAESINESLEGHRAADDVVTRSIDPARGSGADQFQGLVAAFWRCNHYAERSRRAARSRRPLPLVCGAGTEVIGLWRARGESCCATGGAGWVRAAGAFARQGAQRSSHNARPE